MNPEADSTSERPLPEGRGTEGPPPIQGPEWALVAVLLATGTVLRCWQPSHMAVEHFDEGVYASNILFADTGEGYPYRHLYAPPLLPALLELALIAGGLKAQSVMWVNVLAGCLMVPSVWWIGRQWFGPLAGLAAGMLACFSEVHILYSRTALTDVLLCFWLLWGVYWAWKAIQTGRPAAILLAGLFAALAWWTKYNGWLTLAISGAGTAAWLVTSKRLRPAPILYWTAIAALAFLGWTPYLIDLQSHGGYATVAANHAGYVVGVGGWIAGLLRQCANLSFIEGGNGGYVMIPLLALPLIYRANAAGRSHARRFGPRAAVLVWIGVMGLTFVWGTASTYLLMTGVGFWMAFRGGADWINPGERLAGWMIAAWVIGLTLVTPLYTPYPRLALPWVVGTWFGGGLGFCWLISSFLSPAEASPKPQMSTRFRREDVAGIGLVACALIWTLMTISQDVAWQDRRGLLSIAGEIHGALPQSGDQVVYVVGQPGLFFHLGISERRHLDQIILPAANLDFVTQVRGTLVPVFVIDGRPGEESIAELSEREDDLRLVGEWPYSPSALVLLNQHSPQTIRTADLEPISIRLYRVGE